MIKLAEGTTVNELFDWAQTFDGPPPIDGEFGGMGASGAAFHRARAGRPITANVTAAA